MIHKIRFLEVTSKKERYCPPKTIFFYQEKSGCITVVGKNTDQDGYVKYTFNGKNQALHRLIYCMINGPIPPGMIIMHKCDKPGCINPDHLMLGTHADNVADKVSKNRQAKGGRHGRAKLTPYQICNIINNKSETNAAIARRYGVDRTTISLIKRGINWKHLIPSAERQQALSRPCPYSENDQMPETINITE